MLICPHFNGNLISGWPENATTGELYRAKRTDIHAFAILMLMRVYSDLTESELDFFSISS